MPVADGVTRIRLLPPGKGNPRNSEGDFVQLRDERILFVYTHFTGGGGDHARAHLAGRFSSDGGRTWTADDVVVVPNEGTWNVMSVSLLRLRSGDIALFYLRKNAIDDCRPYMRVSADEASTWGEPRLCVRPGGYYVLNNDRAVQLRSGRLVLPVSRHTEPGGKFDAHGVISCFLSDDDGKTWRQSRSRLTGKTPQRRVMLQEPGVVELEDGRLMMWMRTNAGCQYLSYSKDGGETWTPAEPSSIKSPRSPASIERIPKTGDLLLVWNDHSSIAPSLRGKRTPLTVAISRDEGKTWETVKTLEDDPGGWYCYTAIEFVGDQVLLGHCAGQRATGGLNLTQITLFDLAWLYR
ncbi:MAG: sialidase family protein [Planctomycetota bacterium]